MVYDATDSTLGRVHCRLAWSKDVLTGWGWVEADGLTGRDLIPLGRMGAAGSAENAFDSHLCFASRPVRAPEGERIYYAGSNGKHSGSKPHRNASVGLATLRTDGFAAMRGTGRLTTVALRCTGQTLLLTADVLGAGSVVVNGSTAVAGNVTAARVQGLDLSAHVGKTVVLELVLRDAMVYTLGFSAQ